MQLSDRVQRKLPRRQQPPKGIVIEAEIAQRVSRDLPSVEALGNQVPFKCPDCSGILWQIIEGDDFLRYRCHTGHALNRITVPVDIAHPTERRGRG